MARKPRKRDGGQWLTVSQAARRLGKSRPGVLAMIARGELGSDERAGITFIPAADVESVMAEQDALAAAS